MPRRTKIGPANTGEDQPESNLGQQFMSQIGLPAFIISTFFPHLIPQLGKYPKLVKLLSLPLALWIGYEFLSSKIYSLWYGLMSKAMTCVTIDSADGALHSSFRRFLFSKKVMQSHREMSASSISYLRHNVQNGSFHAQYLPSGTNVVFDALNKFQFFWHKRRLFVLTVETNVKRAEASDMTIWTFGLSPEPIRNMIVDAYADSIKSNGRIMTRVFVPASEGNYWIQRSSRPRRPLESVYLAKGQKEMLLADMGEYLDRKTVRWYEDRGIPHRRGYLFHGRPGCGKSTLALALAGRYELNVYVLSLLDQGVDDNALLELFTSIGQNTLVLLEDVDCAGLENRPKDGSKAAKKSKSKKSKEKQGSSVTLSGLLNAIDGAGAPEGHILIMTSNKPDTLDEALVRAGRVDVWVKFANATRVQVRDIFINMYHPSGMVSDDTTFYIGDDESDTSSAGTEEAASVQAEAEEALKLRLEEIRDLAEKFADCIPEGQFSPAELQDYLIDHKNKPEAAIEDVTKWVSEKLGEKQKPSKAETPDDSDSDVDNVFTENQSEHSTAASSTSDLSDVPAEQSESREKSKPGKKKDSSKESRALISTAVKDQLTLLESRLKELESQAKSTTPPSEVKSVVIDGAEPITAGWTSMGTDRGRISD